jgi:hypothetical protein
MRQLFGNRKKKPYKSLLYNIVLWGGVKWVQIVQQ